MLVYTINEKLFLHSSTLESGKVELINVKNEKVLEFKLERTDFFSIALDIPSGKYLVRFLGTQAKIEKHVFINNKISN
jgi:hypothetical protein